MARSAWQSTFRFCLLVWRLSLFYLFACLHSVTGAVSVHGIDAHYKRIHITSTKKASNLETSRNCVFAFAFFLVAVPCFARPPSCFLRFQLMITIMLIRRRCMHTWFVDSSTAIAYRSKIISLAHSHFPYLISAYQREHVICFPSL